MKKLTAFFAVVALGLITTLTASAQINITVTKTVVTPVPTSTTGMDVTTTNLQPFGASTKTYAPGFVTGDTKSFDLGFLNLNPNNIDSPANHLGETFQLDSAFTVKVVAGAFTETQTIHIIYDVKNMSLVTGGKIAVNAKSTTVNPLASFNFLLGSNVIALTINDATVARNIDGTLKLNFNPLDDIPLQIGNLGIEASIIVNPVPEPSTYALMGASGLAALVGFRRFRSKKSSKV